MIDNICQLAIPFTGVIAVYLMASQEAKTRMIGGIFGLLGEPFWFMTAYNHEQWGVIVLVFVYAYSYYRIVDKNRRAL